MVSPESQPEYATSPARQTAAMFEAIVTEGVDEGLTETIIHDEATNRPVVMLGENAFVLTRRVLAREPNATMWVDLYDEKDRAKVGRLVGVMMGREVVEPRGKLAFTYQSGTSDVSGNIYAAQDNVISSLEISFKPEDLQSGSAQDCFGVADELGVGGQWTTGLLTYLRGEAQSPIVSVELMSDPAIAHLNAALQRIRED